MSKLTRRVKRIAANPRGRLSTITVTISAYANGLAPETRSFVAELNDMAG